MGLMDYLTGKGKNKEYWKKYPMTQEEGTQGVKRVSQKINQAQKKVAGLAPNSFLARLISNPSQAVREHDLLRRQIQQGEVPRQTRMRTAVLRKSARVIYPNLPRVSESVGMGKRGRPKGTVKYPGGIYQWRKMQRLAKKAARYQSMLRRGQAMQTYPQMVAQRAYNQQVQQMQVPQEVQGYQQYPQQPQYPQYPQQMPQEPQKRPIVPVFKSSGGSPYPPVGNQTLAPQNETVPQGWVQYADAFTGQMKWKKLPQAEAWIR